MAVASRVDKNPSYAAGFQHYGANYAVPALFLESFPSWFAGFGFAAIAIGALVPAAIMSIAAANLFTRNIYRELIRPRCPPKEESSVAKIASLVVKFGALAFIVFTPQEYAIQLQLLGGVWILQTLPAIGVGLYTRWLHPWALLAGWATGMATGTWMAHSLAFKSNVYTLKLAGASVPGYAALWALLANLAVALVLSAALNAAAVGRGPDETSEEDYGGH
jgi:SSS family solute:Na+ symporter